MTTIPTSACPVCSPQLWDGSLDVVPDAQFCRAHRDHAVRWLFGRLRIEVQRTEGVAQVRSTKAEETLLRVRQLSEVA